MSKCYLERKDVKITIKMNNVYSLPFFYLFFLTFITSNIPLFSFSFPFPLLLSFSLVDKGNNKSNYWK